MCIRSSVTIVGVTFLAVFPRRTIFIFVHENPRVFASKPPFFPAALAALVMALSRSPPLLYNIISAVRARPRWHVRWLILDSLLIDCALGWVWQRSMDAMFS